MRNIRTVPLVRITVEARRAGFVYILRDRNNVECGRSAMRLDSAQHAFNSAWMDFCLKYSNETLFPHQISVPRGVQLPASLNTGDIRLTSIHS